MSTDPKPGAVVDNEIRSCRHEAGGQEPHTCPFAEEIHGDKKTLCRCCKNCEHSCAMDI